jgi:uncharacterized delta-60 repeat protein
MVSIGTASMLVVGAAAWTPVSPGDLDRTFGRGGFAWAHVGGTSDHGYGVTIQPDGKIVQVGYATRDDIFRYTLLRVDQDGKPDSSFGNKGLATAYVSNGVGYGVALQPDGKIVVVGSAVGGFTFQGLARFMPDGRLDGSFGDQGVVVNAAALPGYGLVVQPDGKILTIAPGILARYESDGSLDLSFGDGGIALSVPDAHDLALLADGRILVVGTDVFTDPSVVVGRYTATGDPDTTFGEGGEVRTPIGQYVFMTAIAVQPDDRIVVTGGAGLSTPNLQHYLVVRYLKDGDLDPAFGRQGIVITPVPGDHYARDVAIQADGKVVVVGPSGDFPRFDFTVARYLSNGQADPGFGHNGLVITQRDQFSQPETGSHAVVLQEDGKIVVAGTDRRASFNLALVRYLAA